MADPKEKCSFRYLLQRELKKADFFNKMDVHDEVTKNVILDNIIKEMNKLEEFREYLQVIENATNVRTKYIHMQLCVRQVVSMLKHEDFVVDKFYKVHVTNRDLVRKTLKRASTVMEHGLHLGKRPKF